MQHRQGFFGQLEWHIWRLWPPEKGRRFGWPLGESPPRVATALVTETGVPFQEEVVGPFLRELGGTQAAAEEGLP
jgi:hypothetical protein